GVTIDYLHVEVVAAPAEKPKPKPAAPATVRPAPVSQIGPLRGGAQHLDFWVRQRLWLMAFGNLADVTSSLIVLLEAYVNGHLQQALGPDVLVLPVRPDRIDPGLQNRLSLHLYHITEDPYYKNAAGQGNDPPNVAKAPMSMCLFYILTAHH